MDKYLRNSVLVIFIFILFLQIGCVYYVDAQNGDDRNPGTARRPFKTIHRALRAMRGSDTCYVRNGIYDGDITIREELKGTPSQPTVFMAQPGHHPVIYSSRMLNGFYNKTTSNVQIRGFTIQWAEEAGINLHDAAGCLIADNTISGCIYGIVVESSNGVTVKENTIENNLFWGVWLYDSDDGVIMDNITTGHSDCGIFIDQSAGYLVSGNLSHNNMEGVGLYATGDGEIYNNTFDNNQEAGIHCSQALGSIKTLNNCLTNNQYGFGWYDGLGHLKSDHNNLWNNAIDDYVYATQETVQAGLHDINSNPLYTPDYHLQQESLCIDVGIDVGRPYYGIAPDLGAYEWRPAKERLASSQKNLTARCPSTRSHLKRSFPNPFNATAVIPFTIPEPTNRGQETIHTSLRVYNLLGQMVRTLVDGPQPPGHHRVLWDGRDDKGQEVASGVYLYRLNAEGITATNTMILLR